MKVIVTPNLTASEWADPVSGLTFSKTAGEIEVPYDVDYSNIKRWVVQNYLIISKGSFEELEAERRRMALHEKNEAYQKERAEGLMKEATAALQKERMRMEENPKATAEALRKVKTEVVSAEPEKVEPEVVVEEPPKKRTRKKKTE